MLRLLCKGILVGWFFLLFTRTWANSDPGLKFIENKNQWARSVHFSAKVPGGRMNISAGRFNYYFVDNERLQELHERLHGHTSEADQTSRQDWSVNGHSVEVNFIGANTSAQPLPFGRSTEYYNYFLGDSSHWASGAYAYDGIYYPSFYENISLKVYSVGEHLKYDFVVAPYGDPSRVLIQYSGADGMALENGNLVVTTSLGELIEKRPYAYQFIDGKKIEVASEYYLENNQLSFCFPEGYDPCYELVIDPLLIFSTYSGSTADNWGSTATYGEHGTLYSAGVTIQGAPLNGTYPATAGAFQTTYGGLYDVGILKYDSTGHTLLYASFLGGSRSESPHSLVMNSDNELLVLGTTSSANYPTTTNAFQRTFRGGADVNHVVEYDFGSDIFIARISQDGRTLLSSTLVGGTQNDGLNRSGSSLSRNYGDELRGDIITDVAGNVYVSSVTASDASTQLFPAIGGADITFNGGETDAILFKMTKNLSTMVWSTYLGGSGSDASHTLKLASDGSIYIAGGTTSGNFPVSAANVYQSDHAGDADGWIAHVSANGQSILQATFTGTFSFDQIYFVDLNEVGEVYVYGQTSGDFPVSAGVYSNPGSGQFVQKFDSELKTLQFSTVFGSGRGIPDISPTAFLVSECNNIYMAGWGGLINSSSGHWNSNTTGMPVTSDAFQSTTSGSDFYFIVLTDDASQRLYATFFGGTQSRTHVDGGTSRFDKGGIVYHAVCSGCRSLNASGNPSSDFPTTQNAWSRLNRSQNCNNAAFKFDLSSLKARLQTNSLRFDMPGLNKVCIPDPILFQNKSTGGETYFWDLGDGTKVVKTDTASFAHYYALPGPYTVWLKAVDEGTCKVKDSVSTRINVFIAETDVQDDDDLCEGTAYTLQASGGVTYAWRSADGSFQSSAQKPVVSPEDTTTYYVTITEATGCIQKDTVTLNVIPGITPEFDFTRIANCSDRPFLTLNSLTDSLRADDVVYYDFGDGTTGDKDVAEHHYERDSVYTVRQVAVREFCVYEKIFTVPVFTSFFPNMITPEIKDGKNDTFSVGFDLTGTKTPGDYGFRVTLMVYNRWGKLVYSSDDYQYDWSAEGLAAGIYYYDVSIQGHASCRSWLHVMK